jgi:hypothetical protein
MEVKTKFAQILSRFKFDGPANTFFASIWLYMKIGLVFGQTPIKMTSNECHSKIHESKFTTVYFLVVFATNVSLVVHAHLNMNYQQFKIENPVVLRVTFMQIIAISITAGIGVINTFVMRKKTIRVNHQSHHFNCNK